MIKEVREERKSPLPGEIPLEVRGSSGGRGDLRKMLSILDEFGVFAMVVGSER